MKDFLIVGPFNAVHYKQVFPLIKDGRMKFGASGRVQAFVTPEDGLKKFVGAAWFTTLAHDHINPPLELTAHYVPEKYPRYDNYDAVEVSRTKDIPCDYDGVMGLPLSFVERWNEEQFEIVGITATWSELKTKRYGMCELVHPDGRRERCDAPDAGADLEVPAPPEGSVYYVHGGKFYVKFYTRLLVRKKS